MNFVFLALTLSLSLYIIFLIMCTVIFISDGGEGRLARYLLKRLLIVIPTLLGVMLVIFLLASYAPGSNPNAFSSHGNQDGLDEILETLNLHDTVAGRYIRFLDMLLFRHDYSHNATDVAAFSSLPLRMKNTLLLTGLGFLFAVLLGIPLGLLSALHKDKPLDREINILTVFFSAIPIYVLAILLITIFAKKLRWLPVLGIGGPQFFVLPTITVGVSGVALITSMTRSAARDVLGRPFIQCLRAKGVSSTRIACSHLLKNSLSSVLASMNIVFSSILCSTLITENFFSIPGMGQLIIKSISGRNQVVLIVCVGLIATILILFSILFDIVYAVINPQIRLQLGKGRK